MCLVNVRFRHCECVPGGDSATSVSPASKMSSLAREQISAPPIPAHLLHLRKLLVPKVEDEMALEPGGIIAWLVVGLVAGWLAGQVMRGGGYGIMMDIVLGVVGAFIGGIVFGIIFPGSAAGFWGSIIVAFIGAVLLIGLIRALPGRSAV